MPNTARFAGAGLEAASLGTPNPQFAGAGLEVASQVDTINPQFAGVGLEVASATLIDTAISGVMLESLSFRHPVLVFDGTTNRTHRVWVQDGANLRYGDISLAL